MRISSNDYIDHSEDNLISKEDIALIKIKLGKRHRKESDWTEIKAILSSHNVIVFEPTEPDPSIPVKDHITCIDGLLMVYTNIEDCQEYIRFLINQNGTPGRMFIIGSMPFDQAVGISQKYQMDLYIDLIPKPNNVCMAYIPESESIKAIIMMRA